MTKKQVEGRFLIPLWKLLNEGRWEFEYIATYVFRRRAGEGIFLGPAHALTGTERDAWLEWVNHKCMPRNRQIAELIRNNAHLLGEQMPPSFREFLEYHDWWWEKHMAFLVGKNDPEYHLHAKTNFPRRMEQDLCNLLLQSFVGA